MTRLFLLLVLASCGGTEEPTPGPSTQQDEPAADHDCASYEHQVELCRAECDTCEGEAPGNSCNVCAEACADRVFCDQCGDEEHCGAAE